MKTGLFVIVKILIGQNIYMDMLMNVAGFGKNAHKGLLACFENVNLVRRFAAILRHKALAQNQKKTPDF